MLTDPTAPRPSTFSLPGLLRKLTDRAADAVAVVDATGPLTFGELDHRSSQLAAALTERSVGAGDRVAVLTKNSSQFYVVLFATAKLGAVLAGLNYRLAPNELTDILKDARPLCTFVPDDLRNLLPSAAATIRMGSTLDALIDAYPPMAPLDVDGGTDVLQLYSSGTTGQPKGAVLTHRNLERTVEMGRSHFGMGPSSVNLVVSPLFHIGGVGYTLTTLGQGGMTVLPSEVNPERLLESIEQHRVTHSFMVPAVIQMLVESEDVTKRDLSSLQRIAYGGAPMATKLLESAISALRCEFMGVYGMTETAGTVISLPPEDHAVTGPKRQLLRSIGHPFPWLEIRIVDPGTGQDVPSGTVGEIWVRSDQNMSGYWRNPVQTAETITPDGGFEPEMRPIATTRTTSSCTTGSRT